MGEEGASKEEKGDLGEEGESKDEKGDLEEEGSTKGKGDLEEGVDLGYAWKKEAVDKGSCQICYLYWGNLVLYYNSHAVGYGLGSRVHCTDKSSNINLAL